MTRKGVRWWRRYHTIPKVTVVNVVQFPETRSLRSIM